MLKIKNDCLASPVFLILVKFVKAQAAEKSKNKANADRVVDEHSKTEGTAEVDEHVKIDKATIDEHAELQKSVDSDDYEKIEVDDVLESKVFYSILFYFILILCFFNLLESSIFKEC